MAFINPVSTEKRLLTEQNLKPISYDENSIIIKYRKSFKEFKRLHRNTVLFTCSSAKAMKSGVKSRIANAVYHTLPADKAMPVFFAECIRAGREDIVWKLWDELARVSRREDWRHFTPSPKEKYMAYLDFIKKTMAKPIQEKPVYFPMDNTALRGMTACPWASRWCYSLCLNKAGKGGMTESGPIIGTYRELGRPLPSGQTLDDDLLYLDVMGKSPFFGGTIGSVQRARYIRQFELLLSWALYGAEKNPYYDQLYQEILHYTMKQAKEKGYAGTAVRLNGTSDYPVHTWTMTNGENLIAALGKAGVMCYDYTKDYTRYVRWAQSGAWKGAAGALKNVRIVNGFPTNYHLTFSFSEYNVERSIEILERGGNVAMAFRMIGDDGKVISAASQRNKAVKTPFPPVIEIGVLSRFPQKKNLTVTIFDGDDTDLRYFDPFNWGKRNGGEIVGLRAKAIRLENYTDHDRQGIMRRFVSKVKSVKGRGGKVRGKIMNPRADGKVIKDMGRYACTAIDMGILKNTGVRVGRLIIGGTGEGV